MGKVLIVLACLVALASAQFGNPNYQASAFAQSSFGNQQNQNRGLTTFGNQGQYRQTQNQYQQGQYQQGQYQQPQYQQSQNQQPQNQQPQYQQNQFQPARSQTAGSCREEKERSPVSGSCDRYIECVNGTSEEKLCPDGLRFNPNVKPDVYPCQYPSDVPCLERSSLQPAQPTKDCPHQFGFFKTGDAQNCGVFRNCVNGIGFDQVCPEGLAFNTETNRCDWPDQVADCDAEAFIGFRCPEVPVSRELGPPAGYRIYRSDTNCQKYFICIDGRPRALSCGGESAFDELTSSCVSADDVASCPAELKASAARSREAEIQRLAKQLKVDAKVQQKRRF